MSSQSNQRGSGLVFQSGALGAAPAAPEPEIQGLIHVMEVELDDCQALVHELAKRLEPIYRNVPIPEPKDQQPLAGLSPVGDFVNAQVTKARALQYGIRSMLERLAI